MEMPSIGKRLGRWTILVIVLILTILILQIFHIYLLSKLDERQSESSVRNSINGYGLLSTAKILERIRQVMEREKISDSYGYYTIIYSVWESYMNRKTSNHTHGVTLVTHCSVNHLTKLIALGNAWDGPISVSVFIPSDYYLRSLPSSIATLNKCLPNFQWQISIHLVLPIHLLSATINTTDPKITTSCSSQHTDSKNNQFLRNYEKFIYPNNLLRNVAKYKVLTDNIFTIDIDMLPNDHLYQDLVNLLANKSHYFENMVLIIPAFELMENIQRPHTKRELLELWQKRQLRPFYYKQCWRCQRYTDYDRWRNLTLDSGGIDIAYMIEWKDPYEPFYIGHRDLPSYDERFRQYGFNRISQVCELHVAGYKFGVLNNGFITHLGFKLPFNFHLTKDNDLERNRKLFRLFKQELKVKYPDSLKRCY